MSFPVRKTLKSRRAIVIGSGPGGLSAAISLAVRGAQVVVLEKDAAPAEGLRTQSVKDFRFEPWPPFLVNPQIMAELFASANLRLTDFLTLERLDPLVRFVTPDGTAVDFHQKEERFLEQIAALSPEDARQAKAMLREGRRLAKAMNGFQRRWPLSAADALGTWEVLPNVLSMIRPDHFDSHVRRHFRNPQVRALFLSMRVLSGLQGRSQRAVAQRFLGDLQTTGGWVVEGGAEALRGALLRVCEILNIRFLTNAILEKIELHDGRVRRLHGTGFKPLTASIVVCTANIGQAFRDLLPRTEETTKLLGSWGKLRRSPSSCLLMLGLDKKPEDIRPLTVFCSENPTEESRFLDRWGAVATFPSVAVADLSHANAASAPEGNAALLARVEAPVLSSRYAWSDDHAREVEDRVMTILANRAPEFAIAVKQRLFLSPGDLDRQATGLWSDGPAWAADTFRQWRALPPNRVDAVPGLYLAGNGAFPGQGLGNVVLGGMLAALCAADDAT